MANVELPDEIFNIIVKKVGDEDFKILRSIIRAGKDARDLVLSKGILQSANITSLCMPNPAVYAPGGIGRPIFLKCLGFENHFAIYFEALRLISTSQDVHGALALLQNIVPTYKDAKLAYAMFQMCAGRGDIAGGVLDYFFANLVPQYSPEIYVMGECLFNYLTFFDPPNEDTFGPIWDFPSSRALGFPSCGAWHADDLYCQECYIYNCALRICELL